MRMETAWSRDEMFAGAIIYLSDFDKVCVLFKIIY